jgi:hypothetical protein
MEQYLNKKPTKNTIANEDFSKGRIS